MARRSPILSRSFPISFGSAADYHGTVTRYELLFFGSVMSSEQPAASTTNGLPFVQLFTDGACRGNPGPGGWGCILRHPASGSEKELSGGELLTTNNQMELQAVISGLEALKSRSEVEVVTDSKYVAQGSEEWMPGWKRNGWRTASKEPVKNVDLWQRLDEALKPHEVHWHWIKGLTKANAATATMTTTTPPPDSIHHLRGVRLAIIGAEVLSVSTSRASGASLGRGGIRRGVASGNPI